MLIAQDKEGSRQALHWCQECWDVVWQWRRLRRAAYRTHSLRPCEPLPSTEIYCICWFVPIAEAVRPLCAADWNTWRPVSRRAASTSGWYSLPSGVATRFSEVNELPHHYRKPQAAVLTELEWQRRLQTRRQQPGEHLVQYAGVIGDPVPRVKSPI